MKLKREIAHYNQKLTYAKVIGKPRGFFRLKVIGRKEKKKKEA